MTCSERWEPERRKPSRCSQRLIAFTRSGPTRRKRSSQPPSRICARSLRGTDPIRRVEEIQELVRARLACEGRLRDGLDDERLKAEIAPWVESYARETERIATTLDGLKGILSGGTAAERCAAFLGFGVRVNRRAPTIAQSYGPRRAYYPQIVSMGDDTMALGEDPALFRDRCLSDAFVELFEEVAADRLSSSSGPGGAD